MPEQNYYTANTYQYGFQGYNPADRIPALFETPKLSLIDSLFLRFGISAYEVAPHILVVDLSHWNGDVVWRLLRESGVVAVILKCSEGAEGTYYEYKDIKFELFWRQALDWGFPIMLYHFFRGEKGSAEFDWFLKCSDAFMNDTRILGKTAVYLDCEWKSSSMARSTYTNRAFGFTTLTSERDIENGIYCSPGLVPTLFDPALALWDTVNQWNAHWTPGEDTLPIGWTEERRNVRQRGIYDTHWWVEKVLGAGKVDINHMFYADEQALRQWLGQMEAVSPSPSPTFSWSPSASYSPSPSPAPSSDCCDEHKVWLNQLEDKQIALTHRVNTLEAGQQVLTAIQQSQAGDISWLQTAMAAQSKKLDTIDAGMQVLTEIQQAHTNRIADHEDRLDSHAVNIATLNTSLQSLGERVDQNTGDISQLRDAILTLEANYLELYLSYEKVKKAFCE